MSNISRDKKNPRIRLSHSWSTQFHTNHNNNSSMSRILQMQTNQTKKTLKKLKQKISVNFMLMISFQPKNYQQKKCTRGKNRPNRNQNETNWWITERTKLSSSTDCIDGLGVRNFPAGGPRRHFPPAEPNGMREKVRYLRAFTNSCISIGYGIRYVHILRPKRGQTFVYGKKNRTFIF